MKTSSQNKVLYSKYIFILLMINSLFSVEIHVPQDYLLIQDAIDNSNTGDIIMVSPGVYYESIMIDGKYISLISTHGPFSTTINGIAISAPLINIQNCSDFFPLVSGFTLISDHVGMEQSTTHIPYLLPAAGSIINIINSKANFANLVIHEEIDHASVENNIVFIKDSNVNLNRILYENSKDGFIVAFNSEIEISNSTIRNIELNDYEYIFSISNTNITVSQSVLKNTHTQFLGQIVIGKSGSEYVSVEFRDFIMAENTSSYSIITSYDMVDTKFFDSTIINNICNGFELPHTGAIIIYHGNLFVENSIIINDFQTDDYNYFDFKFENPIDISFNYSIIDTNNINHFYDNCSNCAESNEVSFINPELNNSYLLTEYSPGIDSGNPNNIDFDGTISDIGAYQYLIEGDGNFDNIVNISDILILINLILNNSIPSHIELFAYSSVDDELLDILDIVRLVNLIL
ncbi:MAG: hypothetical protein H8E72_01915 [Candidatus Marinimicrobia bacterium]|nr:hypothetical protein [Candidatus Neomarinimicrobiota bacterium]